MSMLLTKRLARSLWRTKIRLVAVVMMVTMGVFAGATMAGYASNIQTMYDTIYEDTNLGDLWFDNRTSTWTAEETDSLCSAFSSGGYATESIVACEGRLVMRGTTLHEASTIDSLWTSMDPNASVDTLWFPSSGCCGGHPALEPNEVVLSTHVNALDEQGARALPFELGDSVLLGAEGEATYEIVGIALHHENILNAPEGSILPPKAGTYIVGWMSHEGLARISGVPNGSTNLIILDVEGTPSYDLPDTPEDEGAGIAPHADHVTESADALGIEGRVRDRGSHATVDLLRADVEANEDFVLPVTVMIAIIASITIVISLQRLVQSQAREIAILRTLGIPRTSLMRGYLLAPIVIGAIGSLLGAILGLLGMNGLLDFYETFVNVPITSRPYPMASVLGIVGATMIVVVLAGVLPARRAMRLDPLETLSGRNEVRVGSAVLQRLTAWMPTSIGLSVRSTFRRPARLGLTFLAIGVSMMLFGGIQMMTSGIETAFVGGVTEDQDWDHQAYFTPGNGSDVLEWAEDAGARVELVLELPVGNLEDDGIERSFSVMGLESMEGSGMRTARLSAGAHPVAGSSPLEVVFDEGSMALLGWSVGETRSIEVSGSEVEVRITGSVRGEIQRLMIFHRADLSPIVGVDATSAYLADVPPDEALEAVTLAITERADLIDTIETLLETQTQVLNSVLVLGVLFAGVVLFNTMVMNISERDVELSTLRVLGASSGRLGVMLLFEAVVIGLIGGLVGVLFAFLGASGLAASFSSWTFHIPSVFDPWVALNLIATVLVLAVILSPIGVIRLRRMDLVAKVKDLSQ